MPLIKMEDRFEHHPGILGVSSVKLKYVKHLGQNHHIGGFINFAHLITPFKVLQHAFRAAVPSLPKFFSPALSTIGKAALGTLAGTAAATAAPLIVGKIADTILPKPVTNTQEELTVPSTLLPPPKEVTLSIPDKYKKETMVEKKSIHHPSNTNKRTPAPKTRQPLVDTDTYNEPVTQQQPQPIMESQNPRFMAGKGLKNKKHKGKGMNTNKIISDKSKNIMESLMRGRGLNMI